MTTLATRIFGSEDGPTVWILHGILGSKQNWTRFARLLAQSCPHYRIVTIDLRCHGESSFVFEEPHHVDACAHDLYELAQEIGFPEVVLGHSFGGKVALCYATHPQLTPLLSPEAVWTLDSPLDAQIQPSQSDIVRIIEFCLHLPMPVASRGDLIRLFLDQGFSEGMAQWMTTNLKRVQEGKQGFEWKFNLNGIQSLIQDYWTIDGWSHLKQLKGQCEVYLLRAESGMRWSPTAIERLREDYAFAHQPVLEKSGHWVHIDQPLALCDLIAQTLGV